MTTELAENEAARSVDADATLPATPPATAAADAVVADANLADAAAAAAQQPQAELDSAIAAAPAVIDPKAAVKEDENVAEAQANGDAYDDDDAKCIADADAPPLCNPNNAPKRAKKKFALFVAYVGAGFSGMQYNKDQPTIEGTLRDALVAAGLISQLNADAFSKVAWSRAARTDKGVSAVGQVVALRLLVPTEAEGGEGAIAALVSAQLPPSIRVFGASKVRNGFDARKSCDRRRYEYVLPEFAFDSTCCARVDERQKKKEENEKEGEGEEGEGGGGRRGGGGGEEVSEATGAPPPLPPPSAENEEAAEETTTTAAAEPAVVAEPAAEEEEQTPEQQQQQQQSKAPFIFDDAAKARLNSILAQYEGTHK